LCLNPECATGSFLLDYRNRGWLPEVKQLIIDMSLNASGVRDTARSLHISTDTVLSELKKKEPALESVNTALLRMLNPEEVTVDIERAGEAEMDAMWSGAALGRAAMSSGDDHDRDGCHVLTQPKLRE
jgi:hypothetical protein